MIKEKEGLRMQFFSVYLILSYGRYTGNGGRQNSGRILFFLYVDCQAV